MRPIHHCPARSLPRGTGDHPTEVMKEDMRKLMLPILVVAGLLIVSHGWAYATPKDKPRDKKQTIEVVNLNILHGFACDPPVPGDGDQCRVRDRIDLLVEHLIAAGCSDIVTLQENVTEPFVGLAPPVIIGPLDNTVTLIRDHLPYLGPVCASVQKPTVWR